MSDQPCHAGPAAHTCGHCADPPPSKLHGHDVIIWVNPPGGKTSRGETLPAGWVWCCECGARGTGLATEDEASDQADEHELAVAARAEGA